MFKRHLSLIGLFLFLSDVAVVLGCFLASFFIKKHVILANPDLEIDKYVDLLIIELPFVMMIFAMSGLYAARPILSGLLTQLRVVVRAVIIATALFVIVSFYVKLFSYSRQVFSIFFVLLPAGLMCPRILYRAINRIAGARANVVNRVLVFGKGRETQGLIDRFQNSSLYHFELVGVAPTHDLSHHDALKKIVQGEVDTIIVDLPFEESAAVSAIMKQAEKEGVAVLMTPKVLPGGSLQLSTQEIGDVSLIAFGPQEIPLGGLAAKRAMDLALAIFGLIALSPFLALIAVLIKMTSKGPVFYSQRRVGLDGREFMMLKFRTMRMDAERETGPVWATHNDDRCTRIGRFLRKSNLDELPQLFNVIAGSMSLVGPRPERPDFVKEFKQRIPRYTHKHWVKPGMTGWAQINGWRGDTDLGERIRCDIYYLENWSLWLDFKILLLTPFRAYRNAM